MLAPEPPQQQPSAPLTLQCHCPRPAVALQQRGWMGEQEPWGVLQAQAGPWSLTAVVQLVQPAQQMGSLARAMGLQQLIPPALDRHVVPAQLQMGW